MIDAFGQQYKKKNDFFFSLKSFCLFLNKIQMNLPSLSRELGCVVETSLSLSEESTFATIILQSCGIRDCNIRNRGLSCSSSNPNRPQI